MHLLYNLPPSIFGRLSLPVEEAQPPILRYNKHMTCRIISHRGLCRKHFWTPRKGENTIEAFRDGIQALESMGMEKSIEFDIRAAKDGALVVRHYERLDGTTNVSGLVWDYTAEGLQKLDAGYGRKIPLLSEVLDTFKDEDVEFNIELKENTIINEVRRMILEQGLGTKTIISAFDRDDNDPRYKFTERFSTWDDLPRAGAEIRFALLATKNKIKKIGGEESFVKVALEYGASAIHPENTATNKKLITLAHDAGLKVRVWVVNGKREYRELKEMGVDAVFCDNPLFLK